jgi:hypothetical protein
LLLPPFFTASAQAQSNSFYYKSQRSKGYSATYYVGLFFEEIKLAGDGEGRSTE